MHIPDYDPEREDMWIRAVALAAAAEAPVADVDHVAASVITTAVLKRAERFERYIRNGSAS